MSDRSFVETVVGKPLQAGKFIGIILAFIFAVAGFFRFINLTSIVGDPRLGDGQLVVLLVLPLLSLLSGASMNSTLGVKVSSCSCCVS